MLAAPTLTVSICVAGVMPPGAEAVMVGVPGANVSLYLKLVLLLPAVMVTLVMVVVSPISRKAPPAEVVPRLTVKFVA